MNQYSKAHRKAPIEKLSTIPILGDEASYGSKLAGVATDQDDPTESLRHSHELFGRLQFSHMRCSRTAITGRPATERKVLTVTNSSAAFETTK